MSRSRRSKAAKSSRGSWSTRPPSLVAGQVCGELRVIEPDTGKRKSGKRLAHVEDVKTGERGEVIASNLVSGRTVSLGRIKKARYAEYKRKGKAMLETKLENLDPELIADALRDNYYAVNVEGEPIRQTRKAKPGQGYQGTGKDKYGKYRDYYITKAGQLQCRSAETGYNFKNVDKELEHGGKILE